MRRRRQRLHAASFAGYAMFDLLSTRVVMMPPLAAGALRRHAFTRRATACFRRHERYLPRAMLKCSARVKAAVNAEIGEDACAGHARKRMVREGEERGAMRLKEAVRHNGVVLAAVPLYARATPRRQASLC